MSLLLTLVCMYPFGLEFCLDYAQEMGFPGGASGKEPACQHRRCRRLKFNPWVEKDPLEEGVATRSCILAWRIPWTEDLMGYHP